MVSWLSQTALLFSQMSPDLVGEKIETERFYDAVNVILSLQVIKNYFCPLFLVPLKIQWTNKINLDTRILSHNLFDTLQKLLQSSNGGFPAWEPQRAYEWLEVTLSIMQSPSLLSNVLWNSLYG